MKELLNKSIRPALLLIAALTWQTTLAQMSEVSPEPASQPEVKEKKAFNTVSADFTTGWIVTEVTTPEGSHKWRNGPGFELSFRRLYDSGYGISLEFAHSETGYPSRYYGGEYRLKSNYYGVSVLYGGYVGRRIIASIGIGGGCGYTHDGEEGEVGFGLKDALDVEYQLSPLIGIGAGLDYLLNISANQQNRDYNGKKYDITGFKRLALHIGLRVYF